MPNWCSNNLTVSGPEQDILTFFAKSSRDGTDTGVGLSFNSLVPLPEDQQENWYAWHNENWGTKWDVDSDCHAEISPDGDEINYSFDTAWSPPEAWLETVAKLFPTLTFELLCEESGAGYAGQIIWRHGVKEVDITVGYDNPKEYVAFIDEHFGEGYLLDEFREELLEEFGDE